MIPWEQAPAADLATIHTVVTDVDDTLTRHGRLDGATLDALDRLYRAGIRVIPATAASGGWASFMIHSWPVHSVIAENGGIAFLRGPAGIDECLLAPTGLGALHDRLTATFPELQTADDQPYRRTSLAYRRLPGLEANARVLSTLGEWGAGGTVNSLWLLAWPQPRSKLTAWQSLGGGIAGTLYVGDSENDQPMFAHFPFSAGVSTVAEHRLEHWPRWITKGPGGAGFIEIADRLLAARS